MDSSIESFIKFNNYEIARMEYVRNFEFKSKQEVDIKMDFDAHVKVSEDGKHAIVTIGCKIFEEKEIKDNDAPFYLDIAIRGDFTSVGDYEIEDYQLNGMAILFPYLRSTVTSFTSQAGIPPVIIPAINVYNFFKDVKEDEKY